MAGASIFQLAVLVSWAISTESTTRLISDRSNNHCRKEGFVEISSNGLLQHLNDSSNNDYRNARVACREMGYSSVASLTGRDFNGAILEAKDYYLHKVNCTGEELRIIDCPVQEKISINELINIGNTITLLKLSCADFSNVKLIGGNSENEGVLLVFLNNVWGYVCDDDWGQVDAGVVCKQLGYNSTWSSNRYFPKQLVPSTKIMLDDVKCTGNESDILLCSHSQFGISNCDNEEKVGIICQDTLDFSPQNKNPTGINSEHGCVNGYGDNIVKTMTDSNADRNPESKDNSFLTTQNIILIATIPTAVAFLIAGVIVALFVVKRKYRKKNNITDNFKCTPLIPLKEEQYI